MGEPVYVGTVWKSKADGRMIRILSGEQQYTPDPWFLVKGLDNGRCRRITKSGILRKYQPLEERKS